MKVLTDATMVMTWQYTDIPNQHAVYLKFTQYYTAITLSWPKVCLGFCTILWKNPTKQILANKISLQNLKSSFFLKKRIIYTCPSVFITRLFTIFKRRKQPKCPSIDKQINKTWYLPYDGELFSPKQEGNPDTCLQHPIYNKT